MKKIVLVLVGLVLCVPTIAFSQSGNPFEALKQEISTLKSQVTSLQNQIDNIGITNSFYGMIDFDSFNGSVIPESATIIKIECTDDPLQSGAQFCNYALLIPETAFAPNSNPRCIISLGSSAYSISASMTRVTFIDIPAQHSYSYLVSLRGDKNQMNGRVTANFLCVVK